MAERWASPSRVCSRCLRRRQVGRLVQRRYATPATMVPAASTEQILSSPSPIARFPPTQPPSHKPPEFRKSQLHRQYTSLLRSTPLMLLFSHFNLQSREWVSVRRELAVALERCDSENGTSLADSIKLQIIQVSMFETALRVVEYYNPPPPKSAPDPTDPATASSNSSIPNLSPDPVDPGFTHSLSRHARDSVTRMRGKHPLTPLLAGPITLLTFPEVSPPHLKAALSILAPDKAAGFPPPRRKDSPGYFDPAVTGGVQKLLLLGARVESNVFDPHGVRRVGSLPTLEVLRAQLMQILGAAGAGLVQTLEAAGKSLWLTMESRRSVLDEDGKEGPSQDL